MRRLLFQRLLLASGLATVGFSGSLCGQTPAPSATTAAQENLSPQASTDTNLLIVVKGAAGEEQFESQFAETEKRWVDFAEQNQWQTLRIGPATAQSTADRDLLRQAIEKARSLPSEATCWLVFVGHGTFAANVAKFNLTGPDVSATELSEWLKPLSARCVIINGASSSGPFVTALSAANRLVVTATKSGSEQNFARFGEFFSTTLQGQAADLDHDEEVSLLEAFLAASAKTEKFYRENARLATEHALLDDNGDRVGTSSDFLPWCAACQSDRTWQANRWPSRGAIDRCHFAYGSEVHPRATRAKNIA